MSNITITLEQFSETGVKTEISDFEIKVDRPEIKGGGGDGLMGGQYLLIGTGGCFSSTLFASAKARDITISGFKLNIMAMISAEQPSRFTHIKLQPSYEYCSSPETFDKLIEIAEKSCISINTMKHQVSLQIERTVDRIIG